MKFPNVINKHLLLSINIYTGPCISKNFISFSGEIFYPRIGHSLTFQDGKIVMIDKTPINDWKKL